MKKAQVTGAMLAFLLAGSAVFAFSTANTDPAPSQQVESPRPNIVFITMEATRADHIGPCYGYNRTTAPNICELAEDGVLFTDAYAQASHTSKSIPPLLTSLPVHQAGIFSWEREEHLSQNATTVAEVLNDSYRTAVGTDPPSLFRKTGMLQGFEAEYDLDSVQTGEYLDNVFNSSQPVFLWHFIREQAHGPYDPAEKYRLWENISEENTSLLTRRPLDIREILLQRPSLTRKLETLYDGEIREGDNQIGKIINYLKKTGQYNTSLIIFTSDHGEYFGERGRVGHRGLPFEEVVHVPLIVKLPKNSRAGETVEQPVSHLNIVPTIYDYLQKNVSTAGVSLLDVINGEATDTQPYAWGGSMDWAMLRDGDYKYVTQTFSIACGSNTLLPEERLFNLQEDPKETDDIASAHPDLTKQLRAELCGIYQQGEGRQYTAPGWISSTPNRTDRELREQLREMGYLE